jgi:Fe-S-cluster containining protein
MVLDFGTPSNEPPTSGQCCRALALGWSFLELDASYKAAVAGKETFTLASGKEVPLIPDILTIGPMIRLVGVCEGNPLGGGKYHEPRKVWRCIHSQPDFTCGIYDRRPAMCRTYPMNLPLGKCEYLGCQSTLCEFYPGEIR